MSSHTPALSAGWEPVAASSHCCAPFRGVAMLVLKWVDAHPPAVMSQVPLVLFPVAFIALMLALLLAVLRRKSS